MSEMLTAKDVQEMLQVDRSTVYRMAEAGNLPAIKVGKQWRFPAEQFDHWFQMKMGTPVRNGTAVSPTPLNELHDLLPMQCVQLIQNAFADILP